MNPATDESPQSQLIAGPVDLFWRGFVWQQPALTSFVAGRRQHPQQDFPPELQQQLRPR